MGTEADKTPLELAVFREFSAKVPFTVSPGSVEKRSGDREPDILCNIEDEGPVAFELTQLCSPELIARARKADPTCRAISVSDTSVDTVRGKLHKNYKSHVPVELICYTNGFLVLPDDAALATIRPWFDAVEENSFRRAWFLGEKDLYEVWCAR